MRPLLLSIVIACSSERPVQRPLPVAPGDPAACMVRHPLNEVERLVVDDHAAAFCYVRPAGWRCLSVDRETGVFRVVPPPAIPVLPRTSRISGTGPAAVCGTECVELALPDDTSSPDYRFDVNPDGSHVAATRDKHVIVFDAKTGRATSAFDVEWPYCSGPAKFLGGDRLAVDICATAGPDSVTLIFDLAGHKLMSAGINTFLSTPVQIQGDIWAFQDLLQPRVAILDVRAGTTLHLVDLHVDQPVRDDPRDRSSLGDRWPYEQPSVGMVVGPTGLLVTLDRVVHFVDPRTGKHTGYPIPMCD